MAVGRAALAGSALLKGLPLLAALAIGVLPLLPPAPTEGGRDAFSPARAMAHIERLATAPRPIGSPANMAARRDLVASLAALGLAPELQSITVRDYYGGSTAPVEVVNVLARIPGTASSGAVILMGHYDTPPGTPGANDNGAAVAIILEAARAILAGGPLRNDVILLFTDGEEPAPRFGSTAFVAQHSWAADVGFVINLEAIGRGGPSMPVTISGPDQWIIDRYVEAAQHPVAYSYATATARLLGGSNTDLFPFAERGVPGIELAYLHGSSIYHTWDDVPQSVSLATLQQHGSVTLALARVAGDLPLPVAGTPDNATFFTVGTWVVRIPSAWSLGLAAASAVLLAAAAWRRRAWRAVLLGAGIAVLAVVGGAILASAGWLAITGWRPMMGILEGYLYLGALLLVTVGVGQGFRWLSRRWTETQPAALGSAAVWSILGLLLALPAPDLAYPLALPALAAGLLHLGSSFSGSRAWGLVRLWAVAGLAIAVVVPPIDTFFQLAQPRPGNPDSQLLPIIVIPAALLALLVQLVRGHWQEADTVNPAAA